MKRFPTLLLPLLLTVLSGCGYQLGTIAHPQLTSVAVAPVTNDTLAYNASAILRGLLCERFTVDGSLKLKGLREADCIVYARVADVKYDAVSYGTTFRGNNTYLANEWACTVKVEYSVILPGRGKPLIANRTTTGSTRFVTGPDLETSRQSALRQALLKTAKDVVSGLTEGW